MSRKQQNMMRKKFRKWSNNFYREKSLTPHASWKHGGQEYSATFRRLPGGDDMGIERVVVEISTEEDGKRMSTEMRLKRLAFSNFAQLVDRWDPTVELHNDELDGRFHSNSTIYIGYGRNIKPKFRGKVTTASRGIAVTDPIGRIRRDEVFLAGLETGVKRIRLPRHVTAFVGDTLFGDGEYQNFSDDARITFYPNGTYGWRIVGSSGREEICGLPDKPYYIVAAKKKKLYLKGVVKGRILVYSPERIIIENDLTYAHDPEFDTDGANYLGLVSAKNIEVARPDVTGPGDLVIHAAIYAKRRFVVRRYRAKENATLLIHGSVTAGSLSATEPRYRTRIQFDRRLEDVRPPNFPVTNQYEIESWDPQWTIDGRS